MPISSSPISSAPISAVAAYKVVPIAGRNSSGLRRWLIQYYSDYFDKRDKEKELEALSTEFVKQVTAGVISEKVHKPITERAIEDTIDAENRARKIQLQLQRDHLDKQLAAFTNNQAIISQAARFADDALRQVEWQARDYEIKRRLREQDDEDDQILLASIM